MLPAINVGSPLAQAVGKAVQSKMEELGWAQSDDSALSEYVVLMLVNSKSRDQIATELATDLLGCEQGDPQLLEFSKWLFNEVENLNQQINGGDAPPSNEPMQAIPTMVNEENGQDAEMYDGASDSIPTGPKAMRSGRGNRGRMLNQINRTIDRSGDSTLHRVRGQQGSGRIGSHGRDQMKGHRGGRGGRHMGGFANGNHEGAGNMVQMSRENQRQLMSMMEEQARMMSQLMPGFVPPAVNPAFQQNGPQQGRSLFDRVEHQDPRHGRFSNRGPQGATDGAGADMDMDTTVDGEQDENKTNNVCHFNLHCTQKDCPFAHQSPAAPEGTLVDVTDVCSFGAACKNRKCTARHPSPALKSAHQAEEMCKFFPHCTNPHCTFKHPARPLCRNGADCKTEGCKFTHLQTACKFNPCLKPHCPYKHADGQRGAFSDKVWTAGHVSDRKFVEDENAQEELIKPEANEASQGQELAA